MKRLIIIPLIAIWSIASGQDSLSVNQRILAYPKAANEAVNLSFANPALKVYEHSVGFSAVGVSACSSRSVGTHPGASANQNGSDYLNAGAETYMHHKNSTIWGYAYYTNGKQRGIKYNETSDPELIFPYFCADTLGGDLSMETYSLCGGYAAQKGKTIWGVQLSYDAGIYYRNVDPRPKNVTGLIDLSVGTSFEITDKYTAGLSVNAKKYKQSCDIMWMSEAGKTEIYHTTGLGNIYTRFTGASESSNYNGTTYGINATLFPADRQGIVASAHLSHYQFKKILTDLNKLPLCKASHNTLNIQAGYMAKAWAFTTEVQLDRRHGNENIFGDALSGVYPQIGSLLMYADNHWRAGARGAYSFAPTQNTVIDIIANAGFAHRQQLYAVPAMEEKDDAAYAHISGAYRHKFGKGWNIDFQLSGSSVTKHFTSLCPKISGAKAINLRQALGASISYDRMWYREGLKGHNLYASIKMIF